MKFGMKKTLFFVLIILGLFSCENKEVQESPLEVTSIEFREEEELIVSAEITEHQLSGEEDNYAHIEFSVEETDGELISFELYVDSQTGFLASFLVSEEDEDDWSIKSVDVLDTNHFGIILQNPPIPEGIIQEEIICMVPIPCPEDADPKDCVALVISGQSVE